ncbi:MAG TPA: tetratricopeptide repeat protein [Paraburkholderia sp.]|nr:tetratricopeptide repeat protein [Paraburkholderia sp.]
MTAFPTLTDIATTDSEPQLDQDLERVMAAAIDHHRKQEFGEAAALYSAVLDAQGDHADAHYHLAILRMQTGQPAEAVTHFEVVLGQAPNFVQCWIYYVNALVETKQLEAARIALEVMRQRGLPAPAVDRLTARINGEPEPVVPAPSPIPSAAAETGETQAPEAPAKKSPTKADLRRADPSELNRYAALFNSGDFAGAEKVARDLVERYPSQGECWFALAYVLQHTGSYVESTEAAERATELLPDDLRAQTLFANRLYITRQYQRAEALCRKMLDRFPENAALHRTLGATLQALGRDADGIAEFRHAVELAPNDALEIDALGNALMQHGLYDEAEATFRQSLELAPMQAATHSNLLFCLMHKVDQDAASAFAEFREFAARHEGALREEPPQHANDRNPSRQLRVGFVSGDLLNHPVAYFLQSVVEHLAKDPGLSLHFYSNHVVADGFTKQIREHAQSWQEIFGMTDALFAQRVRDDRIDILIDLSGHTGRNRLVAFAQKPAPVQVSWIGNPATTGLTAIDYYMSDRFVTPPEQFAGQFSEKLVFLPALAPFKPHPNAPDVSDLPALKNGFVTFGSFSRLVKIGPEVVALWSRVLREVPDSRLLIGAISSQEQMSKLAKQFVSEGIDPSRISFLPRKNITGYLEQHHLIDVCLDPFPFVGSTTTMHALWMGVPTMTLPGVSMASRGTTGWLSHLGLDPAFVARDQDDYVNKCAALAADLDALATVRRELRAHCMNSPIVSAGMIANAASRALRTMWQRWCDGLAPEQFDVPALESAAADVQAGDAARESQAQATPTSAPITSIGRKTGGATGTKPIRLVCGTRRTREQFATETALGRSLALYAQWPDIELQLFDQNARGLSTIYNAAIDDAKERPAILVFVHDDVWLNDFFWTERIRESVGRFDVVGLAGNLRRVPRQPAWAFATPDLRWDDRRYLSGTVGHGKGFPCDVTSNFGPSGQDCKLLDGLLLIADSEMLANSGLRFDEQFKFHFYDMDFCRQAELKGLRMGTWPLSVVHESGGAFGSRGWRETYALYLAKYGE